MVRLSENDSNPRVKDASERYMRLCNQNPKAEKYRQLIAPYFSDYGDKLAELERMQKEVNFAQDAVWLFDGILDNVLRNLNGRAREYDRDNPGSNTAIMLFPGGNITSIITMPDKDEPDAAHSIAQKIIALGDKHELYGYAAKIEDAVAKCRTALSQQVTAVQNLGNAKTALSISKIALVRQYNACYFVAASDVDKLFAENLFPKLRPAKKKNNGNGNNGEDEIINGA
ncbi:MAG: hypothetical protein U0W24_11985 [Bacteroidales bacterium]